MTSLTIRELRQSWPAAEKALQDEDEIIITRDGTPVAKLVRYTKPKRRLPRLTPELHMQKLRKLYGDKIFPSSDAMLAASRADRFDQK